MYCGCLTKKEYIELLKECGMCTKKWTLAKRKKFYERLQEIKEARKLNKKFKEKKVFE